MKLDAYIPKHSTLEESSSPMFNSVSPQKLVAETATFATEWNWQAVFTPPSRRCRTTFRTTVLSSWRRRRQPFCCNNPSQNVASVMQELTQVIVLCLLWIEVSWILYMWNDNWFCLLPSARMNRCCWKIQLFRKGWYGSVLVCHVCFPLNMTLWVWGYLSCILPDSGAPWSHSCLPISFCDQRK